MASVLSSKRFHSLLGIAVSVSLIIWILLSVDLRAVGNEIEKLRWWALAPALAGFFLHFWLRALRWRFLLPRSEHRPTIVVLLDGIMLGNFATYILPLRAGEFIRPFLLSKQSSYSFSSGFVSVVIERFFDLACVLLTFGILLFYIEGIPHWVVNGAYALSGLAVAILAFLLAGSLFPGVILHLCESVLAVLPAKIRSSILKFISDFITGASVLSRPSNLIMVLFLSALVWLTSYALFYLYFFFFEMDRSWPLAFTGGVIVALAVAAPSAPGFVGVYQTACIAAFGLFSQNRELAVAYSLITHLFQYIVIVLYALIFFSRSNISFSSILKKSRESSADTIISPAAD